jgi:hypothetical protein
MSMHRSLAAALWLLVAAGAYGASTAWADGAHTSKVHPWVLIALFWGAALVSVAIHHLALHLARASEALKGYWLNHAARRAQLGARARHRLARLYAAGQSLLANFWSLLASGREVARHAWSQHKAEARRGPGVLIGWSRSARRALRV